MIALVLLLVLGLIGIAVGSFSALIALVMEGFMRIVDLIKGR